MKAKMMFSLTQLLLAVAATAVVTALIAGGVITWDDFKNGPAAMEATK